MQRFMKVFGQQTCKVIGMIHVDALPGEALSILNSFKITNNVRNSTLWRKLEADD